MLFILNLYNQGGELQACVQRGWGDPERTDGLPIADNDRHHDANYGSEHHEAPPSGQRNG